MAMKWVLLGILSCAVFFDHLSAQLTTEELEQLMNRELQEARGSVELLSNRFQFYTGEDHPLQACDAEQLATFLWVNAKLLQPDWDQPQPILDTNCTSNSALLAFALGSWAFHEGDLAAMKFHLDATVALASTPRQLNMGHQGLGVYFQITEQHDSAYRAYARSFEVAPDLTDAQGFNNLANAALVAEQWEMAIEWSERAETHYFEELQGGQPPVFYGPLFQNEFLTNRLFAQMQLNDRAGARTTFSRLHYVPSEEYNAVMIGATVTAYLLWADDEPTWALHQTALQEWVQSDSALAIETMGAHALLYEPWRTRWAEVSHMPNDSIWDYVRSCPRALKDLAWPAQIAPVSPLWDWQGTVAGLGMVIWMVVGIVLAKLILPPRRIRKLSTADLTSQIDEAFASAPAPSSLLALNELNKRFAPLASSLDGLDVTALSPREREVLEEWIQGLRPKESAVKAGVAASAIYNTRSIIRRKLNIPDGESIEEWQRQHSNTKPPAP